MPHREFLSDLLLTPENIIACNVTKVRTQKITNGLILDLVDVIQSDECSLLKNLLPKVLSLLSGTELSNINVPALLTKHRKKKDAASKLRGVKKDMFLRETFCLPTQTIGQVPLAPSSVRQDSASEVYALRQELSALKSKYTGKLQKATKRADRWYETAKQEKRKLSRLHSAYHQLKLKLKIQTEKKERICKVTKPSRKHQKDSRRAQPTDFNVRSRRIIERKKAIHNLQIQKLKIRHMEQQKSWEQQHSTTKKQIDSLTEAIKKTGNDKRDLTQDNEYLQTILHDNAPLQLKNGKLFSPETVHCVMDLLSHNVSASQVGPVIKSVAKLCGRSISETDMPHRSTVDSMRIRGLAISHQQLQELKEHSNMTLYTDETRKRGTVYMSYAVTATDHTTRVLGIQEVPSKSAQDSLDRLISLLESISKVIDSHDLGAEIIVNIKNTMSDRASTEKLFNDLLFKYRAELVPRVIEGFDNMSPSEQSAVIKMNNFFCGLHLTVSLADEFSTKAKEHEGNNEVGAASASDLKLFIKKNESSGVRFVRTACKLFAPGGQDQFNVHDGFSQYVLERGKRNALVDFRHNRFNILFFDGAVAYHLANDIHDFIESVHGTTNSLLKAVMLDSIEPGCLAGARALGLLCKSVTSPLWRILEDDSIPISDIGDFYNDIITLMKDCLQDDTSMNAFITGDKIPTLLTDHINKDEVWDSLVNPHFTDQLVKDLFSAVFRSWIDLLQRLVADHLPSGCFSEMSASDVEATKSTKKHNKLCEELFGHLDRLIRLRPRATTLTHESHIIYRKNRISEWLERKDEEEREHLIEESRAAARQLKYTHSKQRDHILKHKKEALKEKQTKIEALQKKFFAEKERLTSEIITHGLWQTSECVDTKLATYPSANPKLNALKLQLQFRRNVLGQPGNKALFQMSSAKDGKFSVQKVTENLKTLITFAASSTSEQEDRISFLAGKRIRHKFQDNEENIHWYPRLVISQVPGFDQWFNVIYDGDETVYTFRLQDDVEAGDVELLV